MKSSTGFTVYADVTNLCRVKFLTGIQRVVISLISRLAKRKDINLIPLKYDTQMQSFVKIDKESFYEYYIEKSCPKGRIFTSIYLKPKDLEKGSIFLDTDSVWNTEITRSYLYPILKKYGIRIITLIHDTFPITMPQFCYEVTTLNFISFFGAAIKYSDRIITSTNSVANDIKNVCEKIGEKCPEISVMTFGSDFNVNTDTEKNKKAKIILDDEEDTEEVCDENVLEWIKKGKYILMVGTIEPRKNHAVVLDALENGMNANVIFAGKIGWNISDFIERVENHPLYGKKLFMINDANDITINTLYENAFLLAFPTFNEGFGLPMIEAFSRDLPVIASDIPVLREVGGKFADYFDNTKPLELVKYVNNLIKNPEEYKSKKELLKTYVPTKWDESEKRLHEILMEFDNRIGSVPDDLDIKQMVVLTARNEDLIETLPYIEKFMPFIKELVLCTPPWNVEEFKKLYHGRLKVKFLTDDVILNGRKLPKDHSTRNFFLRCLMMENDETDDVFIMSDDDYRPLVPVDKNIFINNGKYIGYYCYDIKQWQGRYGSYTSYDICHFKTRKFLEKNNYPTLQYSSHQPQIIDKRIYREILQKYKGIESKGYDEWSIYFNIASTLYPDKFKIEKYITLGWPGTLPSWDLYTIPQPFIFENFYANLYTPRAIFGGLSTSLNDNTEKENQEKMRIFNDEIRKQYEGRAAFESYERVYSDKCGEVPSVVVFWDEKSKHIKIHVPGYIEFKCGSWTRLPITFYGDIWSQFPGKVINIQYHFHNKNQISVLSSREIQTEVGVHHFKLPIKSPNNRVINGRLIIQITVCDELSDDEKEFYAEKGKLPEPENRGIVENSARAIPLVLS